MRDNLRFLNWYRVDKHIKKGEITKRLIINTTFMSDGLTVLATCQGEKDEIRIDKAWVR